jgi:hypothetical protein
MRPLVAICQLKLGTRYRSADRTVEAWQALRSAADQFRSMEMSAWLDQAEAALAETRPIPAAP